ncbi:hypothetical protein SKAU_G00318630 [Synaphobranchus kaupii]|uniref:Uncharacterized protein n=1 Tax=Synaphobranchus kaupii TaxID=118154 RepID=A0A9Q1ETB7_SYNKA|nr:hypothetical protein SKAU_G00318630 [Synaphobranchus kaupii]
MDVAGNITHSIESLDCTERDGKAVLSGWKNLAPNQKGFIPGWGTSLVPLMEALEPNDFSTAAQMNKKLKNPAPCLNHSSQRHRGAYLFQQGRCIQLSGSPLHFAFDEHTSEKTCLQLNNR